MKAMTLNFKLRDVDMALVQFNELIFFIVRLLSVHNKGGKN
jgi:hypothetical protein